jgi:hypothetical protein
MIDGQGEVSVAGVTAGRAGVGRRLRNGWRRWAGPALALFVLSLESSSSIALSVDQSEAEVSVVALLVDSSQAASEADRAELSQLALALPPTSHFMVCLLQSAYCTPPVPARGQTDRTTVQDTMSKAFGRTDKVMGLLPRTEDVARILNRSVNKAFQESWNENRMIAKGDNDRQVLIVLASPTIYIDIGGDLHHNSIPGACFPDPIRPAEMHSDARLKLVLAVPKDGYPASGVDALARILSDSGKAKLDGIYQVMRRCPKGTENIRNWMKSVVPDGSTSCQIQPIPRNDPPESLSCVRVGGGTSPALHEQLLKAPPYGKVAAANSGATNAPSASGAPARTKDASAAPAPTKDASATPAPTKDSATTAPAGPKPSDNASPGKPDQSRVATAPPVASPTPPPSSNTSPKIPAPLPTVAPAVVPDPVASPKPLRPGPDPATVVAAADSNPSALVTGALVSHQLAQEIQGGPAMVEFIRSGEGFDLKLALAAGPTAASGGASNPLVLNPPLRAGSYRILATPVAGDPNCLGGRRIRGVVNVRGRGVVSARIALDLEVSRCAQNITPIAIGTLVVK